MPTCFKCRKELPLKDLCHHLRHVHLLYEPVPFNCAEGTCCRTFTRYNSLYRHISLCHLRPDDGILSSCPALVQLNVLPDANDSELETTESDNDTATCSSVSMACNTADVQNHAAHFLLSLTATSSMTLTQVNYVRESVTELVSDAIDIAKQCVSSMISDLNIDSDHPKVKNMYGMLQLLQNPFNSIDTMYKLDKYVSRLPSFVQPTEHSIGQRWEGVDSHKQQHLKDDTFMYVSVEKTLRNVLRLRKIWDEMCDVDDESASDDISSFFSGKNFRNLYSQLKTDVKVDFYPVVLQLYYDDFETTNPIGTKTGLHKLGGFYFRILNLSRKHNAKLDNIHLVALTYRQDIAKYGMSAVLEPIVRELLRLESGLDIATEDGSTRHVICILGNVVADNLGLHGILGYTESFSHSYACDFCYGTTEEIQSKYREIDFALRNRKDYAAHCDKLKQATTKSHIYGLKSVSSLSQLKYYHPVDNDTCDVMHDILEGVAPYETSLLLQDVVSQRKLVSIDTLNEMLARFDYGTIMSSSKPSAISVTKLQNGSLGQHSHQMLVLLYVLPLIIGKYMTHDDVNWKLFILLLEILDIVFAPTLTAGNASYLAELIAEHHILFCKLYPEARLKYKQHRMVHYPSVILKNGPLSDMWVMRYEARHGYFKRLAHVVCNFRNVCKTLATRNQMRQAIVWSQPSHMSASVEVGTGSETVIHVQKDFHTLYADTLAQEAFLANSVRVCGTRYEIGYTVVIDMDPDGYPILGYIVKILVCEGVVSFAMRKWTIVGFDSVCHSYSCLLSFEYQSCHQKDLLDFHPLYAHQCSDEDCGYHHIRLRHLLCSDN